MVNGEEWARPCRGQGAILHRALRGGGGPPKAVEGAETGTVRVAAPSTTPRIKSEGFGRVVPLPRFAVEDGALPLAHDCRLPKRYSLLATRSPPLHHSPFTPTYPHPLQPVP